MICPIKTDPNWIALEKAQPKLAYYLWNEYEGNVPAKYFNMQPTQVKEGVPELFESNPELASIGTPEQYSQYLDSIFPESKVKDIVYHGSLDEINKFNENQHFGTLDQANLRVLRKADDEDRYDDIRIYPALINVSNSKEVDDAGFDWSKEIQKAKKEGFDSLTYFNEGENYAGSEGDYKYSDNSYLVFSPKNSYILGNKQDIEGFKKFVGQEKSTKVDSIVSEFYNSNPELQSIGSVVNYQEHLNKVYPNHTTEYRGDSFGMESFYYSEPTEQKRKEGKAYKIGPGVYTTRDKSKADAFALENKGERYTVIVDASDSLVYKDQWDFWKAVGEYHGTDLMPNSNLIDSFVRAQHELGKSIRVDEYNESSSPLDKVYILGNQKDIRQFRNYMEGLDSKLDIDVEDCSLPS